MAEPTRSGGVNVNDPEYRLRALTENAVGAVLVEAEHWMSLELRARVARAALDAVRAEQEFQRVVAGAPSTLRIAGDLTPQLLDQIRAGLGEPGDWDATVVAALVGEIDRLREQLREMTDPTAWTAPDGTVFDLTRPVYDRDGDEWVHDRSPWSTMAMTDGDLGPRLLGDLFEQYSPLTQDPDVAAKAGA